MSSCGRQSSPQPSTGCGNMMLCLLPLCQVRDAQQGSVQYWHEQQCEAAARQDKLGNENCETIDCALLPKRAREIDGLRKFLCFSMSLHSC